MTMIFQLLVFTCACALGAAGAVPAYGDIWDALEKAIIILQENVLSMDGNVPALNDPRRHYAAIVYVVHSEAVSESSCLDHDYYRDYQNNINESLPFVDANPQIVIQETRNRIDDVLEAINEGKPKVLLAAGLAATELIVADESYFAESSQNFTSHEFVIKGAEKLKNIVMALKNLYEVLYLQC